MVDQGDENDGRIFFIHSGEFSVDQLDYMNPKVRTKATKIRKLQEGDIFGELSPLYNSNRTATVRAINFAQYGMIEKDTADEIFGENPFFGMLLKRRAKQIYNDSV